MTGKVKEVREYLKKYADAFYMLFFLPLAGCVAMGISSSEMIYKMVFAFAMVFYMMKIFVTDYSLRQWLVMTGIMALLGYVFLRTREKALILTTLAIFGCKDVSVRKVLKYTVFVYAIGMVMTIGLVKLGIRVGEIHELGKGGGIYEINDYGFSHPNSAYSHLLMIALMIVVVWQEKIRWYHYTILSAAMYMGYRVFLCRTGLLIYVLLCLALLLNYLFRSEKLRRVMFFVWSLVPVGSVTASFVLACLYKKKVFFVRKLDYWISGRIRLSYEAISRNSISWFGTVEKSWRSDYYLDNAYMNLLLNYGFLILILTIMIYYIMTAILLRRQKYYELIVVGIVAIYAFMEYSVVNVTWNPMLLYMVVILLKKESGNSAE